MKNYIFVCLFLLFIGLDSNLHAQQTTSNKGKEFLVSFLENLGGNPTLEVHLTGDEATTVSVKYPAITPVLEQDVNVTPGDVTIVTIPMEAAQDWQDDAVDDNAVSLTSDKDFVAYLINRSPATSDAGLGLPINTFNREYIVLTNNSVAFKGLFAVVAAYDDTEVTITPSKDLVGGRLAGAPFTVMLDQGEGYYGQENVGSIGGLTGTIISSTRPVGVTNGNTCANFPAGACDHNFDVAFPVQAWGTEILAANLPNRSVGPVYRIVASKDDTIVNKDGVAEGTIDRGEYLDIGPTPDDFVISANEPIGVIQIQPGKDAGDPGQVGDPAMSNLVPSAQYGLSYTFSTVDDMQFPENFIVLISHNDDLATITLDGAPVGAGQFSAIGASDYSVARLAVASGVHETSSNNPHSVLVLGYAGNDSYQYLGGAQLAAINNDGDILPPVCTQEELEGPPPSLVVTGTDNQPAQMVEGEETEDTGIYQITLLTGSSNITVDIPSFVPGEGEVSVSVDLVDAMMPGTGTLRFTDGVGNTCDSEISFNEADEDRECTESEVEGTLYTMDGGAGVQHRIVSRMARLYRRAGGTALNVNAVLSRADSAYTDAWTSAWQVPTTVISSCENENMCDVVDLSSVTEQYTDAVGKLRRMMNKIVSRFRLIDRDRRIRYAVRSLRRAGLEVYDSNISAVNDIPTRHVACN